MTRQIPKCQLYDIIPRDIYQRSRALSLNVTSNQARFVFFHSLLYLLLLHPYSFTLVLLLIMSDPSEIDHRYSQLEKAAHTGDLFQVQDLVRDWPPQSPEGSLQSALQNAVRGGHLPVASYLLAHGASFSSDIYHSALASKGAEEVFQLALDHGWNINEQTDLGAPVFTYALYRSHSKRS